MQSSINLPAGTVDITTSWLCLVFNPVTPSIGHRCWFVSRCSSNKEDGSKLCFYHVVRAVGDGPDEDSSVKVLRKSTQVSVVFQVAKTLQCCGVQSLHQSDASLWSLGALLLRITLWKKYGPDGFQFFGCPMA